MRLTALFLALVLCLSLSACGAPAAENSNTPGPSAAEPSAEVTASSEPSPEPSTEPSIEPSPEPPALIADTLDPADYAIKQDEYTIPCPNAFSNGIIADFAERKERGGLRVYMFKIAQNTELFFEYLDLLINEFGFVVTDSTQVDFEARTLKGNWAITLDSTRVSADKTVGGDLPLYTPSHVKLAVSGIYILMEASPVFMIRDTGHRWSGAQPDTRTVVTGERSHDAFYSQNGQIYNESDGLLSVPANVLTSYELKDGQDMYAGYEGMASIIIDNRERVTVPVKIELDEYSVDWDEKYPRYELRITDFLEDVYDEELEFCLPTYVREGQAFTYADFYSNSNSSRSNYYSFVTSFTFINDYGAEDGFGASVSGVRVLRWDKTGGTNSVLYIHLELMDEGTKVHDLEILVSAPVNDPEYLELTGGKESYTLAVGETMTLKMDGRYVFSPNYDTYEWIVAAGDAVEIVSAGGDTCVIRAVKPGVARVKCTRQYGTDEEDVLTGISRNDNHVETESYTITVE